MTYVFCNNCGHRNPPTSGFCSSCGSALDSLEDRTITLTAVDPLLDGAGAQDDLAVPMSSVPRDGAVLIVRAGPQAGERLELGEGTTLLGRHPDSDIMLDDITVSRRHVAIERTSEGYVVRDEGSLNGTYINQERVDRAVLRHGDELQIGKFRLVLFERADG